MNETTAQTTPMSIITALTILLLAAGHVAAADMEGIEVSDDSSGFVDSHSGKPVYPRYHNVRCDGTYPHHLQGVCLDDEAIYWSFTTTLVKSDLDGKVLQKVPVANHHGDLCSHEGRLYVAVNLGAVPDERTGLRFLTAGE
jgi:hypothetical protein